MTTPPPTTRSSSLDPPSVAPLRREEIEEREDQQLIPQAMRSRDSKGRVHAEPDHDYRTAYMRDRDRIIHASAFRKLEYKTQVFVNHEGDYYRTRLTHTIEVAQISRTAARALRLNEDLTESIALSHDVGHGPFGHKGEDVLQDLMEAHGGFEHNAHGLRVVDLLEHRYPRWRGLNLSHEVREAFALHSPRDTESLGFPRTRQPALEAQLVDVCDSLTYLAHDLDDGIASGLVDAEGLRAVELWTEHWEEAGRAEPRLLPRLRVLATVKRIIDAGVTDLVGATRARLDATNAGGPAAVQALPTRLVGFEPSMHRKQQSLRRHLYEHFYCHARLMEMGEWAREVLTRVFGAYQEQPGKMGEEHRAWAEEVGLERAVCDRIAGMSDREAREAHRTLAP